MRPRLLLLATTCVLVLFGLLMIFSASSVTALSTYGDAAYFLERQALLVLVGAVAAVLIARFDYHVFSDNLLIIIWLASVLMLAAVVLMGFASHGATRWISIFGMSVQPSEFAKVTIVLTGANICQRYAEDSTLDFSHATGLFAVGVGLPLLLILIQPDKGTTIIVGATLLVMLYLVGIPGKLLGAMVFIAFGAALLLALKDDYSRARVLTMLDPWEDPYGNGYQLIQGWYAFGSGGLLGVGIGMSRQKYSYLPEAHNDFIFAVIGEECGLIGTAGVVAGFALFVYAGIQISRYAPDLSGRLIAAGCTSLIAIQFLVNVLGVLGIMPMTGKPLPFLSYGGSSIVACLMLVGMIVSVSKASSLPETIHDRRRASVHVADDASARASGDGGGNGLFHVFSGGHETSSAPPRQRPRRIDLGPSASERLRDQNSGPRVRGGSGRSSSKRR